MFELEVAIVMFSVVTVVIFYIAFSGNEEALLLEFTQSKLPFDSDFHIFLRYQGFENFTLIGDEASAQTEWRNHPSRFDATEHRIRWSFQLPYLPEDLQWHFSCSSSTLESWEQPIHPYIEIAPWLTSDVRFVLKSLLIDFSRHSHTTISVKDQTLVWESSVSAEKGSFLSDTQTLAFSQEECQLMVRTLETILREFYRVAHLGRGQRVLTLLEEERDASWQQHLLRVLLHRAHSPEEVARCASLVPLESRQQIVFLSLYTYLFDMPPIQHAYNTLEELFAAHNIHRHEFDGLLLKEATFIRDKEQRAKFLDRVLSRDEDDSLLYMEGPQRIRKLLFAIFFNAQRRNISFHYLTSHFAHCSSEEKLFVLQQLNNYKCPVPFEALKLAIAPIILQSKSDEKAQKILLTALSNAASPELKSHILFCLQSTDKPTAIMFLCKYLSRYGQREDIIHIHQKMQSLLPNHPSQKALGNTLYTIQFRLGPAEVGGLTLSEDGPQGALTLSETGTEPGHRNEGI